MVEQAREILIKDYFPVRGCRLTPRIKVPEEKGHFSPSPEVILFDLGFDCWIAVFVLALPGFPKDELSVCTRQSFRRQALCSLDIFHHLLDSLELALSNGLLRGQEISVPVEIESPVNKPAPQAYLVVLRSHHEDENGGLEALIRNFSFNGATAGPFCLSELELESPGYDLHEAFAVGTIVPDMAEKLLGFTAEFGYPITNLQCAIFP